MSDDIRFGTRAVHGGEQDGDGVKGHWEHSLTVPIAQTSTYVFEDTQAVEDFVAGRSTRLDYGRYGNPTQHIAERLFTEPPSADYELRLSADLQRNRGSMLVGMMSEK